jgi:hypothetical protein
MEQEYLHAKGNGLVFETEAAASGSLSIKRVAEKEYRRGIFRNQANNDDETVKQLQSGSRSAQLALTLGPVFLLAVLLLAPATTVAAQYVHTVSVSK